MSLEFIFEEVYSGNEVEMSLDGSTLKVTVIESEDHPLIHAEENAIASYIDWTLDINYLNSRKSCLLRLFFVC